jgi:hypothetical protein
MKKHTAPIIAAILLLLPVLYVGSYLAMVKPPDTRQKSFQFLGGCYRTYRIGGRSSERFFWPLEQIDRKLRPGAWNRFSSLYDEAIAE